MKNIVCIVLAAAIVNFVASSVRAETATKDECVAKVKEAVEMVKSAGIEATVAEVDKKDGKFVWKDSYVFMFNSQGMVIAHPIKPELKNDPEASNKKDANGKLFIKEMVDVATSKGKGWVDYVWPKPGQTNDSPRAATS